MSEAEKLAGLRASGLEPEALTLAEVAVRLSTTVKAVRQILGRGAMRAVKLSARRTRIPRAEFERYKRQWAVGSQ